jgi:hypothetical protein
VTLQPGPSVTLFRSGAFNGGTYRRKGSVPKIEKSEIHGEKGEEDEVVVHFAYAYQLA